MDITWLDEADAFSCQFFREDELELEKEQVVNILTKEIDFNFSTVILPLFITFSYVLNVSAKPPRTLKDLTRNDTLDSFEKNNKIGKTNKSGFLIIEGIFLLTRLLELNDIKKLNTTVTLLKSEIELLRNIQEKSYIFDKKLVNRIVILGGATRVFTPTIKKTLMSISKKLKSFLQRKKQKKIGNSPVDKPQLVAQNDLPLKYQQTVIAIYKAIYKTYRFFKRHPILLIALIIVLYNNRKIYSLATSSDYRAQLFYNFMDNYNIFRHYYLRKIDKEKLRLLLSENEVRKQAALIEKTQGQVGRYRNLLEKCHRDLKSTRYRLNDALKIGKKCFEEYKKCADYAKNLNINSYNTSNNNSSNNLSNPDWGNPP